MDKDTKKLILRPVHFLASTPFETWKAFHEKNPNMRISLHLFLALKPKQIKRLALKKALCPLCSDLQDATEAVKYLSGLKEQRALNEDEEAKLAATKLKFNAGQMHKALAKDILEAYQALERDLPKEAAMLVLDFTQVCANQRSEQTGDQWWSAGPGIHWLCIVVSTRKQDEHTSVQPAAQQDVEVRDCTERALHPCPFVNHLKIVPEATSSVEASCRSEFDKEQYKVKKTTCSTHSSFIGSGDKVSISIRTQVL